MGALEKFVDGSKRAESDKWKERHQKAQALADDGKLEEAVVLYKQNLDWSLGTLGKDHDSTVFDQETLAYALYGLRKYEEARKLDEAALNARIRVEGVNPPSKQLLEVQVNLAKDYVGLKKHKEAVKLFQKTYETFKEDNMQALKIKYDIAACWHNLGDYEQSRKLNQEVLDARIQLKAPDAQITLSKEALKQNVKRIDSARRRKEAVEKKKAVEKAAAEMEVERKANEKKEADEREADRKAAETQEFEARVVAEIKAAEKKEADKKEAERKQAAKAEEERKRIELVASQAIERERLAKEARMKERAEKKAAEEKERVEKREARRIERQRIAKEMLAKDNVDKKAAEEEEQKTVGTSSPVPIPKINIQRPQPRASSVPRSDSGMRPGSPRIVQLEHRPRANSQDSRAITDKLHFRHISRSEIFSQIGPVQSSTSSNASDVGSHSLLLSGSRVPDISNGNVPPPNPKKSGSPSPKPEQSTKSTPDLSRSRSLNARIVCDSPAPSPSSVSHMPANNSQFYRQLFDAKGGKDDQDSIHAVNSWFHSLEFETQKLLKPLRRSQGKRVKIAILDTGVDLTHPDFEEDQAASRINRRIKSPEDFLDVDGKAHDTCGHGTYCVGLLRTVAPEADIYVARVAKDFDGVLDPEVVAKAINRACKSGKDSEGKRNWNVDILTMSFGFYGRSRVVQTAIQQALSKPVLVFAAASNNGTRRDVAFPAWLQGVICINSATADGVPSSFNPELNPAKNFSIIGENVKSAWINHQNAPHKPMSGTSVATPIAAGIAALVLEYVLQNDPESFLMEQLDDFKQYDGMTTIFSLMAKSKDGYRNVVPWSLFADGITRTMVTGRIEWEMRKFRGQ